MWTSSRQALQASIRCSAQNHDTSNGNGNGSPRVMFQHLLDGLRREELTGVLAHETSAHGAGLLTLESAEILADTVIHLHRGRHDRGVFRRLEITKSRGQPFDEGEHTLHITDGKGLEVFRRVQSDEKHDELLRCARYRREC